ncbi:MULTISPECIES: hypothetical protein [unclassified Streptomyces]|uniref:hypothetical protein n=1 Tax=unclassified Streptomyces TaxID=2593676 RepID=UPI00088570A5|nr:MULTISPECIES: hypothetical protein [unclassified Streptomyces]PBC72306.1 hypothetical protein BX261_7390 [Streptomyces sp. 2321.6]SDR62228.1 hypothetical protein SAMN05216511_7313 [Streptomyces sp. KS_16]SEE51196.1 hypothetical protein SAMN05428940_7362 [Streptomyces sp. 2133.1]SNC77810.1 hypothetical protein SAMN06272741_7226 [Streptomyces sp. 2114.4]
MPAPPEPHEAVEATPWAPGQGPSPTVQTWPRTSRPALRVFIRGQWRRCPVIAVHRYRDGRTAVQVDVHLDSDTSYQARTYRWDPDAMRIAAAGDPPLEP